jgi:hypothetical protein
MPDADGYPTKAELRRIRHWQCLPAEGVFDFEGLLHYVATIWWHPDLWTIRKRRERAGGRGKLIRRYSVSTGGWSGNEEIINALQDNRSFWWICWTESRRGGHYEFQVPAE